MRIIWLLGATALLVSCNSGRPTITDDSDANDARSADANAPTQMDSVTTMSLLETTWEFSDGGQLTVITIDSAGAYVENRADGTHVDHGTYVQNDGKDCFTSAMEGDGVSCWTAVPAIGIGATASATSDSGENAMFKRVEYRQLMIPS